MSHIGDFWLALSCWPASARETSRKFHRNLMKSWDRVTHRQNNLNFDGLDQIEIYKGRKDPTMCKKNCTCCLFASCLWKRSCFWGRGIDQWDWGTQICHVIPYNNVLDQRVNFTTCNLQFAIYVTTQYTYIQRWAMGLGRKDLAHSRHSNPYFFATRKLPKKQIRIVLFSGKVGWLVG